MNGSAHFFVGQCRDDTLDLPPVAETDDISGVAALLSARCSLKPGVVAKAFHEVGSLGECSSAGNER